MEAKLSYEWEKENPRNLKWNCKARNLAFKYLFENRVKNIGTSLHTNSQLIPDNGAKSIPWHKESLFNNEWGWGNSTSTCR